jgi:cellulose synthase/poly-beta-1,6-N-acetylglucosamine synthase-like glycosyltransferase
MTRCAPLFSVIVPVYNDEPGLALCLEALSRQSLDATCFEVLVVDNGSARSPGDLVSKYRFARLLKERQPGSYSARNTACRAAAGEFLAFTDADCRPHPDWLRTVLGMFQNDAKLAAVGGGIQVTLSARPTAAEVFEKVFAFPQHKYVERYGFAATANLIARRSVFEQVGPFDGMLKSSGDRDWGQRLHQAGYRMAYAADALVAHPARASLRDLIRKRRRVVSGLHQLSAPVTFNADWATIVAPGRPRGMRMGLTLLFAPRNLDLRWIQGIQVLLVAGLLSLVSAVERVRLWLGGRPFG